MTAPTKKGPRQQTITERVAAERAPTPAQADDPVPPPKGGRLEAIPIRAGDKRFVRLALELLGKQLTSAKALIERLDLDTERLQRRNTDADGIKDLLDSTPDAKELHLPGAFARTLRIAVAIEYDRVKKLQDEQESLLIEDDDVSNRLKHLESLLKLLDDQLTLPFGGEGSAGQG